MPMVALLVSSPPCFGRQFALAGGGCPRMLAANMTSRLNHIKITSRIALFAFASALALAVSQSALAAETGSVASNPRIDFGIVVKDAARTAKFLTNAIGFKEVKGFHASADLGRKIGLIDGHPVDVRVFVLDDGEQATRVKILSFPDAPGQQPNQSFIHSALGVRYLTLYVKDMKRALARLKEANVPLLADSPVDLGGGNFLTAVKDPDGVFVELIGPMKE